MSSSGGFTSRDREALVDGIRSAESLPELVEVFDARSEHEAYFEAKRVWREHNDGWFESSYDDAFPGDCVTVGGHDFHVHGITHAGTDEERELLREHFSDFGDGVTAYCEQGVRRMYFEDLSGVCEMDDYSWSLGKVEELRDSGQAPASRSAEDIDSLRSRLRDSVFALVESGKVVYGEDFADSVGDVASSFLTSHVDASRGDDFESFRLTREVARNPERLGELQAYYRQNLLPQPLESDWMRAHDPEIELFTHARNERMADYAVYHNVEDEEVRLIVGAAHQPGVVYCLEQHRDGERTTERFELAG